MVVLIHASYLRVRQRLSLKALTISTQGVAPAVGWSIPTAITVERHKNDKRDKADKGSNHLHKLLEMRDFNVPA